MGNVYKIKYRIIYWNTKCFSRNRKNEAGTSELISGIVLYQEQKMVYM
jgi:hypothetical protein